MPRKYEYRFEIICHDPDARADLDRVEQLIDLSMQELVFDEEFQSALNEHTGITIRVQNMGEQSMQEKLEDILIQSKVSQKDK